MNEGRANPADLRLDGIKSVPEDFGVQECLALSVGPPAVPRYAYLSLRKRGITTFEAIRQVARALGVPEADVQYAGLKDEDGVTEQLVSVPASIDSSRLGSSGMVLDVAPPSFVRLEHRGFHEHPISVGSLEGNVFSVVMRSLQRSEAEAVVTLAERSFYFLNYYDTQRFGVPGGPRTTHRIGEALEIGDHERALALVRASGASDSEAAQRHTGPARDYFAASDPRRVAFYLSAYASFLWNATLSQRVSDVCSDPVRLAEGELELRLVPRQRDVLDVLGRWPSLPYPRYRARSHEIERSLAARDTVVQVRVRSGPIAEDELCAGRTKVGLSFFLPSGSYATMCCRQLRLSCPGESAC